MNDSLEKIKLLIEQGELQEPNRQMLAFARLHKSRYVKELIIHSARVKELSTDERKGVIHKDDARRESNRLIEALLDLIDEIDQELYVKQKNTLGAEVTNSKPLSAESKLDTSRLQQIIEERFNFSEIRTLCLVFR